MQKYISLFGLLISLSSCGIYRQNVINVPLVQQKGQAQVSAHVGLTGYDGQVSFAPTKHIALLANYSDMGTKKTIYSSTNYTITNHNFKEIGAGYFNKKPSGFVSEYFLIVGNGFTSSQGAGGDNIAAHIAPYTFIKTAHYNRYVLQCDFGKSEGKLEYAVTPRVFLINYYNVLDTQNDSYKTVPNSYLWSDVSLTLRYNPFKFLKISSQIGLTLPITGSKVGFYEASPFNCSIGLIMNLNLLKTESTN